MANRNFLKDARLEVEFSELSQKAFTKMIHFRKRLPIEHLILSKGLKRSNTKSFKVAGLSRTFLHKLCAFLVRIYIPVRHIPITGEDVHSR